MGLRRFKRKCGVVNAGTKKTPTWQREVTYASSQNSSDSETSESSCAWSGCDSEGDRLCDSAKTAAETPNTPYTQRKGLRADVKIPHRFSRELHTRRNDGSTLNQTSNRTARASEFRQMKDGSVLDVDGVPVANADDRAFVDSAGSDVSFSAYESSSESEPEALRTVKERFPKDSRIRLPDELWGALDTRQLERENLAPGRDEDSADGGIDLSSMSADPLSDTDGISIPKLEADEFVATSKQITDQILKAELIQSMPTGEKMRTSAEAVVEEHAAGRACNMDRLVRRTMKWTKRLLNSKPLSHGFHWCCFKCGDSKFHVEDRHCESCVTKDTTPIVCAECQQCTPCQLRRWCSACAKTTQYKIDVKPQAGICLSCTSCGPVKREVKPEVKFEATNCQTVIDLT